MQKQWNWAVNYEVMTDDGETIQPDRYWNLMILTLFWWRWWWWAWWPLMMMTLMTVMMTDEKLKYDMAETSWQWLLLLVTGNETIIENGYYWAIDTYRMKPTDVKQYNGCTSNKTVTLQTVKWYRDEERKTISLLLKMTTASFWKRSIIMTLLLAEARKLSTCITVKMAENELAWGNALTVPGGWLVTVLTSSNENVWQYYWREIHCNDGYYWWWCDDTDIDMKSCVTKYRQCNWWNWWQLLMVIIILTIEVLLKQVLMMIILDDYDIDIDDDDGNVYSLLWNVLLWRTLLVVVIWWWHYYYWNTDDPEGRVMILMMKWWW